MKDKRVNCIVLCCLYLLGMNISQVWCVDKMMSKNRDNECQTKMGLDFVLGDTVFKVPYIDKDEWREQPIHHKYVHGGFKGTDTRFSFYFPSKEKYQGHFFQYITPVPDSETLSQGAKGEEDKIGFSISHGAYFIETNGGGSASADPMAGDKTIGAYRANAAAAQYSRFVAEEMYNTGRPFGYAFGGSGGAYRTIGGIENTDGVWDGAVPYVVGSPMAIPNVFSVRMHAMRVLKDKFPQIVDALEPGGTGDMYAGLNDEERQALKEATGMGFPPESWFGYKTMGIHAFAVLYLGMVMADPAYFKEFWTIPGYLGSHPTESLLKARIQKCSVIKAALDANSATQMGLDFEPMPGQSRGTADAAWQSMTGQKTGIPVAFQLNDIMPAIDFLGGDLLITSGKAAGKTVALRQLSGDKIVIGVADPKVLALIQPGDSVQVDNSNFLAAQTYYRHQVPKSKDYYVWDQFRGTDGKPIYPQRPMQLGPLFTKAASGALPKGEFKGKMIVIESLWDREAFPWQADWYRTQVRKFYGDSIDTHFRLWYVDHALHGDFTKQEDPTHTISYLGVLQQALLDLSNWVEKGMEPPATTNYKIMDGQVIVASKAAERNGIQPVIDVQVNGKNRADIKMGESVTFTATIEVPANAGKVIAAQWNFDGEGTYPVEAKLITNATGTIATVKTTYAFKKQGTYFPTLRAVSQRDGDILTPFTRIQNLERVRVVVK